MRSEILQAGTILGSVALLLTGAGQAWTEQPSVPPKTIRDECVVYQTPASGREIEAECGERFPVEAGVTLSLQIGNAVMPFSFSTSDGRTREEELTAVLRELVEGGIVRMPWRDQLGERSAWVFSTTNPTQSGHANYRRVVTRNTQRDQLLVPPGDVIVTIVNSKGEVEAVGRPVRVRQRTTTELRDPAQEGAQSVFGRFTRPTQAPAEPVEIILTHDDISRRPNVTIRGPDSTDAIWYDVQGRSAQISATSPTLWMPPETVYIGPRQVTEIHGQLRAKPSITVSVPLPEKEIEVPPLTITISAPDDASQRSHRIDPGETIRFDQLRPGRYRAALRIGNAVELTRSVDLTNGEPATVEFPLTPIEVSGTVFYGSDPAPARVTFEMGPERALTVESSDDGTFSAVLWERRMYAIQLTILNKGGAPLREFMRIEQSDTIDFHIPRTEVLVRVTDKADAPLEGALVAPRSTWRDAVKGEQHQTFVVKTDSSGSATLPPLREGTLEVRASAEGFEPSDVVRIAILAETNETITLRLRRKEERETRTVAMRLPDGRPAALAEAVAFTIAPTIHGVWSGKSSSSGELELPVELVGATVLIRHPEAATHVILAHQLPSEITLPSPSPPLLVKTLRGETPASVYVALWVGDVKLYGELLAFAAWSNPVSQNGDWLARNLPKQSVRILAASSFSSLLGPEFDALARSVPFPWLTVTTVSAID